MDMFLTGQICLFPYDFTPFGFYKCEGQSLQTKDHSTLYALIGNKYGGDQTFFLLPDLTGIAPSGCAYYICWNGIYPSRT